MSEFQPVSSAEKNFTINSHIVTKARIDDSLKERVVRVGEKTEKSGIFNQEADQTKVEVEINRIVELASNGIFSTYKDFINSGSNPNVVNKVYEETGEVLSRGFSLALNSNQETQTALYSGTYGEYIPKTCDYNNNGESKFDLKKRILEVTITDGEVRDFFRKVIARPERRADLKNPVEKNELASIYEDAVKALMKLPTENDDEVMAAKSYFSEAAAILRGNDKVGDGSVDKNGVVARADAVDTADVKAVVGGLTEAVVKNTEALIGNTGATEKNTGAILDLNEALKGYTTTIQTSTQMEILANLKSKGIIDKDDELSAEIMSNLQKEVDDLSLVPEVEDSDDEDIKIAKTLNKNRAKQLATNMKIVAGIKLIKNAAENGERKEALEGDIGMLYEYLDFIEGGTRSIDDLSTNASKFGCLYRAQNGDYDKVLEGSTYNGKEVTKEDVDIFKKEIGMRLFLHSFNLAASKCSSIEDIMRVVSTMHEGDIGDSLDKLFLSTFLDRKKLSTREFNDGRKKGTGLNEIPVDTAWDLRQKGYFEIENLFTDINASPGFKDYLYKAYDAYEEYEKDKENEANKDKEKYLDLYKLSNDIRKEGGFRGLLKLGTPELMEDKQFGIDKPIYQNWFGIEKGASVKAKLIQEYMVWKIMEDVRCSEKNARKAFDLAHKLSVATFMDSSANLAFAQDDYAEIINFKFLRYCDGPGGKPGRLSKSKAIGHPDTISYVNSLTCHWMHLLKDSHETDEDGKSLGRKRGLETTYSPLYTKDIDLTKYKSTTAMPYHFFGVVGSQVEFIKDSFFNKFTPNDIIGTSTFINKIFSKINKTTYDMCRAKIKPIYSKDMSFYDGLDHEDDTDEGKIIKGNAEARVAEKMRKAWLMNVFRMASLPTSGWTRESLQTFIRTISYNSTILNGNLDGQDGLKRGTGFISEEELRKALETTNVENFVLANDRRRRRNKG